MSSIYRIKRDGKVEWVHVSPNGARRILRWFGRTPFCHQELTSDSQEWIELDRDGIRFSIPEIATRTEKLPFSVTNLQIDETESWAEVFHCLNEMGEIIPVARAKKNERQVPTAQASLQLIPLTRMRRFYETMRMLNEAELQNGISTYLVNEGRSDRIKVMFEESALHFQRYANTNQTFHNRENPNWRADYINNPAKFAHAVVARLHHKAGEGNVTVNGYGDIGVVDYEISPFRTTGNATFEDGTSGASSGSGGLDLLLRGLGNVPVVGEIKAPTDRDMFLALIQSLTYAIEVTTPAQLQRLSNSYPNHFGGACGPQCDIMLIFNKNDSPLLMENTKKLSMQLLSDGSPVARQVRRIVGVSADLNGDADISLNCEWSSPPV